MPPASGDPDAARDEKLRLLQRDAAARRRPTSCADSSAATATRPGVAPDSQVETFAALRLHIDTWRWAGVPFYIRAGKCLPSPPPRCWSSSSVRRSVIFDDDRPGQPNYYPLPAQSRMCLIAAGARGQGAGRGDGRRSASSSSRAPARRRDDALRAPARRRDARRRVAVRARGQRRGSLARRRPDPRTTPRRLHRTSRTPGGRPRPSGSLPTTAAGTIRYRKRRPHERATR